jgi:hypothetical protein
MWRGTLKRSNSISAHHLLQVLAILAVYYGSMPSQPGLASSGYNGAEGLF